jgi:hypothetical protein
MTHLQASNAHALSDVDDTGGVAVDIEACNNWSAHDRIRHQRKQRVELCERRSRTDQRDVDTADCDDGDAVDATSVDGVLAEAQRLKLCART